MIRTNFFDTTKRIGDSNEIHKNYQKRNKTLTDDEYSVHPAV